MIFKAGEGSGKSGSFFFFSKDNKFLIKTLKKQEKLLFFKIIDEYIDHIKNGESLLARIYGIFSIKTELFKSLDIMVMQNTSLILDKKTKKISFDLKGSLVDRYIKYDINNI